LLIQTAGHKNANSETHVERPRRKSGKYTGQAIGPFVDQKAKRKRNKDQKAQIRAHKEYLRFASFVSVYWFKNSLYPIAIRKLIKKRKNVDGSFQKRDIIADYTQFESDAYAPITRNGCFLDKNSENYQVKSKYLDTFEGLYKNNASVSSTAQFILEKFQVYLNWKHRCLRPCYRYKSNRQNALYPQKMAI
jgi:hypothetical protein